ncbi:GTP cyclohydrolase I [Agromyces mariniharenae]|uniref:GTP cyclohydrolase 1 n=1 Tax=Agromyces mariniharenae TaxID=2604423 RepID=A0A5S4V7Z6_9MICO|nr:GTP cyclohydrolase I [Agromyces mariniharenae]NUT57849.1 GTP cyclohydrolase I [Agromyces sp.]TYL54189.1 GTP cyclohydrolase I [Agromyces mariniharenae]HEU0183111.1 GTP cyclohydrolase I [Agromyces mariniharenae]
MAGVDTGRIERAVHEILLAIGEDPERPGLERTPQRVAEAYADFFGGLAVDPMTHLADTVPLGDTEAGVPATSDAVVLRDIAFRSVCEHHLLPFVGTAHVAYLPAERVVGLGRIPAVIETLAARPQLQERLTEEIADTLEAGLDPKGVLVVLDAQHRCVTTRGSRQERSSTITIASRGALGEPAARAEIIALIGSADRG